MEEEEEVYECENDCGYQSVDIEVVEVARARRVSRMCLENARVYDFQMCGAKAITVICW